ncbi:MAG: lipase, partial [Acidimicrobiaceae bacterium]|nr:lipase [Acidimicrobiaceae bacterium]
MRCEHVRVTDDVTLVVRRHDGDGRPFLLVHGLASNARLWDGVADHLAAADHAVVTVDQRGHGQSSKPDHGYDFATVVADLVALIDALDLDRPIVAGQSWGGNVVLELA